MNIIELENDNDFVALVEKSRDWVLVDFYALWCGPCKIQKPVVNRIADAYLGKLKVYAVDVDRVPNIAMKYTVHVVPSLILLHNGNEIKRWSGLTEEKVLKDDINRYLEKK